MKKMLLAVFSIFILSSVSMANGWGLGVKLGLGGNDPKGMEQLWNTYGGTFTKSPGVFAIEGQYEWDLPLEKTYTNKIGLRFGFDFYGENKLEHTSFTASENTTAFPITVYFKTSPEDIPNFSVYLGGGITILSTEAKVGNLTYDESKVFPHLVLGGEYRFNKTFALGLELKCNIEAQIEKDNVLGANDVILSDRSGAQGALVARFYF